jgi:hypothetical protein
MGRGQQATAGVAGGVPGRGALVGGDIGDVRTLRAPLRTGVVTDEYQLEPVACATDVD